MNAFLEEAGEIFATACAGADQDCDMAILISPDGSIYVAPAAGWALEPLRLEHGARAAYRVERRQGRVRVEASAPHQRCLLEEPSLSSPEMPDFPRYWIDSAAPARGSAHGRWGNGISVR